MAEFRRTAGKKLGEDVANPEVVDTFNELYKLELFHYPRVLFQEINCSHGTSPLPTPIQ